MAHHSSTTLRLMRDVRPVRVQPPGELLRERACPGHVAAGDDVEDRPGQAAEAEPVVRVEVPVLPGEQGVDEVLRAPGRW